MVISKDSQRFLVIAKKNLDILVIILLFLKELFKESMILHLETIFLMKELGLINQILEFLTQDKIQAHVWKI